MTRRGWRARRHRRSRPSRRLRHVWAGSTRDR